MKRAREELVIQNAIEAALGAERDLLLLRNVVTIPNVVDDDGNVHRFPVGLGTGSPDLVGILRIECRWRDPGAPIIAHGGQIFALTTPFTAGVWFCLEVKKPGEVASLAQEKCHSVWRRFGAFIAVVDSVDGARIALDRARRGAS